MFVESGGQCLGLVEEGQGAVDGGVGTGKGQTKKIPKTPRTPKLKQKTNLAHILIGVPVGVQE